MPTCYRHPSRETGVACSSCERPICPDCMTSTPVGMRCPECARQRTKVKTMASVGTDPMLTYILIAISAVAFISSGAGSSGLGETANASAFDRGALNGPKIADEDEYWRLVTGGFLHASWLHLLFNMYLLYVLGQLLEPAIGRLRFGLIYAVALLAGSFGALLLTPSSYTVGASGAVFGLMGGAIIALRARGIDPWQTGLGITLLLNLAITFTIPGISIGGHLGGLAGGVLAALALFELGERRAADVVAYLACGALAIAAVLGALAVAGKPGLFA